MAHGTATMETDHKTHGAPLPQDEIEATKEKLLLPNQTFYVPDECIAHFQSRYDDLKQTVSDWTSTLTDARSNSQVESLWKMTVGDELPDLNCPEFEEGASLATRKAFGTTLDFFATQLPHLVGGSADL